MTPTERATNVIERITRLLEGATEGPWTYRPGIREDNTAFRLPSVCSDSGEQLFEASTLTDGRWDAAEGNASLIVILRNVGLEGIVGPIRDSLNMLQEFEYLQRSYGEHSLWTTGAGYSLQPRYLEMKAGIEKWCDRWEPELDREERWSPQLRTEIRER